MLFAVSADRNNSFTPLDYMTFGAFQRMHLAECVSEGNMYYMWLRTSALNDL